jgi:RNA polymerase sigma factor (sigma-70 family)
VRVIEGRFASRFPLPAPVREGVAFAVAVINNDVRNQRRYQRRHTSLAAVRDRRVPEARSPSLHAERAALRGAVVAALRCLTPRERQVAMLHWLELRTVRETAGQLGVAVKTAEELLRRARRKLYPELRAWAPAPGADDGHRSGGRVAEGRRGIFGYGDMEDEDLAIRFPPAPGGTMSWLLTLIRRHPLDALSTLLAGLALGGALTALRPRDALAQSVPCLFGSDVKCREVCQSFGACTEGIGICCTRWATYYYQYVPGRVLGGSDAPSWWPRLF